MIGFSFKNFRDFKAIKANFFDTRKVQRAMTDAARGVLSRAGAFVMKTARGLIRTAETPNDVSKPNRPPKSHTGILKDRPGILFAYDDTNRSVVIGPSKLNGRAADGIPKLLEVGGSAVRSRVLHDGKKYYRTEKKLVEYEPRPYMGPALNKNIEKFPSLFTDSLKG